MDADRRGFWFICDICEKKSLTEDTEFTERFLIYRVLYLNQTV